MKHVRLVLDAGGREDDIHPMYDVLANAAYVERATAMHWNFTGDELGIMHYVEGDVDSFRTALESIPEVRSYELTTAGDDAFYAYVRDATSEPLRELFETVTERPVVVVPPVEYREDGTVAFSVVGPPEELQAAIDRLPDPITAAVTEVGGMEATPGVLESLLTERQRAAIEAALERGYYEIPREAGHEVVADELGCAPSTAAEHLRKAEAKLLRSLLRRDGGD
ncbi:helix-turn-helix domain-containing protein [Natronobacterium texcoconense]|uniref:Predicted DNA binding protein, contains HTH domain n=1 Tax=Natronobacterium texcoconense TaxID=1095778 RepID=A0A1H1IT82_NATTX|nr:helix-turn-helix domain-containing protein [Natronobacterium texcoconense]SDR40498.1 Predicted DNA binding protein, contains HTH domain [Natronobacterium texcoconense]